MKKMLAAVLHGQKDVRMEEVPVPEIGEGEVLVKIKAALTCGTDAKVFLRGYHAKMLKPPCVFGHEFAGVVEEVGEGVNGFEVGEKVVAANSAPCGKCFYCKLGRESLCHNLLFINGAYAEYIKIPAPIVEQNLLKIPEHVSFKHAALVEPLACVVHGVEESNIKLGDTVAIIGAGPIGLMFLMLAKLKGARVISSDAMPERLEAAKKLGADEVIDASKVVDQVKAVKELTEGWEGVDVAIEAVGVPELWEKTILMARKGGTVNLFGGCAAGTSIKIDTELLHYNELTIKGVFHHTPYYVKRALDLIASNSINAGALITHEFPLNRVKEALELIVNKKGIKSAVIP
jgi:L-iditol 2-dehydrogenase